MQRVVNFNEAEFNRAEQEAIISAKKVNEIIAYLKENEIELSQDELSQLFESEFSEEKCTKIAQSRFTEVKPKNLRDYARQDFVEDLQSVKTNFGVYEMYNFLSFVTIGKDKATVNKKALEEHRKQLTYTISTPEEIALHDLHLEICEKLNKFIPEAQKFNHIWSEYWFQLFRRNDKNFTPLEIKYS